MNKEQQDEIKEVKQALSAVQLHIKNALEAAELPREEDAADLVLRLATNTSASSPDVEMERRIAALGIKALPALEPATDNVKEMANEDFSNNRNLFVPHNMVFTELSPYL